MRLLGLHTNILNRFTVRRMDNRKPNAGSWKSYVFVIGFLAIGLFSLLYWGAPNKKFLEEQRQFRQDLDSGGTLSKEEADSNSVRIARRYVVAVQNRVCSQVIELTWWMQERLTRVREDTDALVDEGVTLDELCETIVTSERSRLQVEGIEDRDVFEPMAEVRVIRVDAGRPDLVKSVSERVWLKVSYPVPTHAAVDPDGNPIKSMVVGMNISTDGYVLKAGVIGNLEIDFDSISYDW